jgi:hypothetical protein
MARIEAENYFARSGNIVVFLIGFFMSESERTWTSDLINVNDAL